MSSLSSDIYGTTKPVITSSYNREVIRRVAAVSITVASGKLTDGDILSLCVIPAGHRVVGLALDVPDLDEGAALVWDLGLLDAGDAALDTVFISAATVGQAAGVILFPNATYGTTLYSTAAAATDKVLAIEIKTTANTIHADNRTLYAIIDYVAV